MAIVHTDEELRAAWQKLRRAGWPATFEEAMADKMCSRQIRIEADCRTRRLARALTPKPVPVPIGTAAAAQARHPSISVSLPRAPALFDRKRAAAGERDDD